MLSFHLPATEQQGEPDGAAALMSPTARLRAATKKVQTVNRVSAVVREAGDRRARPRGMSTMENVVEPPKKRSAAACCVARPGSPEAAPGHGDRPDPDPDRPRGACRSVRAPLLVATSFSYGSCCADRRTLLPWTHSDTTQRGSSLISPLAVTAVPPRPLVSTVQQHTDLKCAAVVSTFTDGGAAERGGRRRVELL